ncbi:hypothetical protein V6N13_046577 [Hibiscus sabdariffa]|uniref:Longin domain-containing protein n=2 Tax=Hibiscus sabdariffa TaxID=183260 RepID=A0ABR2A2B8_9ROSI
MVKLTLVGRVKDGLPLAQEARYLTNETTTSHNLSSNYKQQAEFLLHEISRGALPLSSMTVRVDHHSFKYPFPYKLFPYFHFLMLERDHELNLFVSDISPEILSRSVIANIRKQYIDTRTQANLSKLNANRRRELDVVTENMSDIIERRRNSEILQTPAANNTSRTSSPRLEAIALIWTPIAIIIVVALILLWASIIFTDDYLISTL